MRLAYLLPLLLAASCTANKAYRVKYPAGKPPAIDPVETASGYRLAFIEFDDQGEMFERGQLTQALDAIAAARRDAAQIAARTGRPAELAVFAFVHGWKNNASERSSNVRRFREMLAELGSQFEPVVGIYIGWRGASSPLPGVKELTYWGRRNKSATLPDAHFTETLKQVMLASRDDDPQVHMFSLLLGHSFGGGLLKAGTTQTIVNAVLDTPPGEAIRWPADLIVFVNEASPALRSYQLVETLGRHVAPHPECGKPVNHSQYHPAILSVASKGDSATLAFFPMAQAISRPFHRLRRYPEKNEMGIERQSSMYYRSAPHSTEFHSHLLDDKDLSHIQGAVNADCAEFATHNLSGRDYLFVQRPGAKNRGPYWVTQMPKTIVADHGGIFSPEFRKLLIDILVVQREPGGKPYRRK